LLSPKKLRVAAVRFLNAAPLLYNFTHAPRQADLARRYDVKFELPNLCASRLARGTADIGLVPVAALAANAKLAVIPGPAIASLGDVRSILLVTRRGVPLQAIRSVALDATSRTSAALVKVVFSHFVGATPDYRQRKPELRTMLRSADAALLIGDPALRVSEAEDCDDLTCYDLSRFWKHATGLPFVFALWAVRSPVLKRRTVDAAALVSDFRNSRDAGLANMEPLVKEWAAATDFSAPCIRRYWTENIHYSLDEPCRQGLQLFFKLAAECGALPPAPQMRMLD
jgi:chorismate dehydratase